jgi:hypothetical protein
MSERCILSTIEASFSLFLLLSSEAFLLFQKQKKGKKEEKNKSDLLLSVWGLSHTIAPFVSLVFYLFVHRIISR